MYKFLILLKQIHVNPTFFKAQSNEKYVPLVKDEAKRLENGNIISLLPDKLAFQVVFEDASDKKNEPLENGGCKQEVSRYNTFFPSYRVCLIRRT